MSLGMRRALAWLLPFSFGKAKGGNSLKFQRDVVVRASTRAQHRERGYKIDITRSAESYGIRAFCAVRQIVQFRRSGRNYTRG